MTILCEYGISTIKQRIEHIIDTTFDFLETFLSGSYFANTGTSTIKRVEQRIEHYWYRKNDVVLTIPDFHNFQSE